MTTTFADSPAVLVDAYSQIFRAFYAIAHLSRSDGFPTNALLGMGRLLFQIEKTQKPRRGAVFFDCGKPAFRLELAPAYKSNRPPMPEPLRRQMPVIRELIAAFGWQAHQCENYEADDLIGAAVRAVPRSAFLIISSDKDLAQLIDGRTAMLVPARNGGWERRGVEETVAKFAVRPEQMVDYLAMLGDNADVIHGVPGIGPRTAADILGRCGSLEAFFAAPELLDNPSRRQKLLAAKELLERNRKLIELRCVWPDSLPAPEETLTKKEPDRDRLAELFRQYELRSLLKELPAAPAVAEPPPEPAPAEDLFSFCGDAAAEERERPEDDVFAGWPRR